MSNDPVDGGTVRYHRAEFDPDDDTWRVWFRPTGGYYTFNGAEGEAMGLTPPEPAPLVVECRGHRIELSDLDADVFQRTWAARATYDIAYDRACDKLAGLLRDARQDPQPASDDGENPDYPNLEDALEVIGYGDPGSDAARGGASDG